MRRSTERIMNTARVAVNDGSCARGELDKASWHTSVVGTYIANRWTAHSHIANCHRSTRAAMVHVKYSNILNLRRNW